jgi:hypothetical protein
MLNLLAAFGSAHDRAGRAGCEATTSDRRSDFLFGARVAAVFGMCMAISILVLALVPQISLAARVQMTAQLWLIDLWGFMAGLVGGSSFCDLFMRSRIYGFGRKRGQTTWAPRSRIGALVQLALYVIVSGGIGFFMANAFLHGMHPKPLQ